MPVTLRPFAAKYRDDLLRMRTLLWPDSVPEEFDELISSDKEFAVFVAISDSRAIGFVEVSQRPFADGCSTSPVAYIEGIWVDDGWRRAGAGSMLIEAAIDWARSNGYEEIASDCETGNSESYDFHLYNGFTEASRIICLHRKL